MSETQFVRPRAVFTENRSKNGSEADFKRYRSQRNVMNFIENTSPAMLSDRLNCFNKT